MSGAEVGHDRRFAAGLWESPSFACEVLPPFLWAQITRARALVADARGDGAEVEETLVGAETMFRELGYPYWTARTLLDRAEWLAAQTRLDESAELAALAAATFEAIGATPMIASAQALLEPAAAD